MSYTNQPTNQPIDHYPERAVSIPAADYHDHVRWGPIIAGLAVALSTQLVLSALGAAVGATGIASSASPQTNTTAAVGIWAITSLFISLFIGGWVTARACGPMNRGSAVLNGGILWATTLGLSAWLLSSGVSGAFGLLASNAGEIANQVRQNTPNLPNNIPAPDAQKVQEIAGNTAKASWVFALGSLLGLVASMVGSVAGTRRPRTMR
jgi:hypothetical protein